MEPQDPFADIPEPEYGIAGFAARIAARLRPKRTDWDPDAVPLTPIDQIPPDQGDDNSYPEEHGG